MKILTHNLGLPRIGAKRELKKALESFWAGQITEEQLQGVAGKIREQNWKMQQAAGIDLIPSNDFSFYDHVLDTSVLVGAVPERFGHRSGPVKTETYFAMARGKTGANDEKSCDCCAGEHSGVALEMTKWFDTNYHYLVPEFKSRQEFYLASSKPLDEWLQAKALGIETVPVLLGPVSFLLLGKGKEESFEPLSLLASLLPVYEDILQKVAGLGVKRIQFDEPLLATDLTAEQQTAFALAYRRLRQAASSVQIILTNYFGALGDNLATALALPVDVLHLDLIAAPQELGEVLRLLPDNLSLSLGVVEGRNIWRNDFAASIRLLQLAREKLGDQRLLVSPSCSLLHVPVSVVHETQLNEELKSWLAFAEQKLEEVVDLTVILAANGELEKFTNNQRLIRSRRYSPRIYDAGVQARCEAVTDQDTHRQHDYPARRKVQEQYLQLPLLPTTTIGSFPQTKEVRAARAKFKKGELSLHDYEKYLEQETGRCIKLQEELGLDVLVHGEFERNDMVEYFGEQLSGFAFTQNGWVQSYGSRCVKPPVIFGDVRRPEPMTLRWSKFAQSLTTKPMKGMLTGPITILQWSFVRNDQPRSLTAKQIALAIRDEVSDLASAGIGVIQIDEPALREGCPLRRKDWPAYLELATTAFRLATSGVPDRVQIHTHMCYCEFNGIMEAIAALDADVISIETSRSGMELLRAFTDFRYPNEIGPGVWDIHSPRVPAEGEMESLLRAALKVIPAERLWINPDCGLKTRDWPEVLASLRRMLTVTQKLRKELRAERVNV
jgi:5-methyltetrahydropteroyltriglutamate--homocysteine methyltransferase